MPFFKDKFSDEVLAFMGWVQTSQGWSHLKYQTDPGPKPDLHSPLSFWWILDSIVDKGYSIKFLAGWNPRFRHYRFCMAKMKGKRWCVRDYPPTKPHLAILGLILKVKRFPDGMPMSAEEYLKALTNKQLPPSNLSKRLGDIKNRTRKGLSDPPI